MYGPFYSMSKRKRFCVCGHIVLGMKSRPGHRYREEGKKLGRVVPRLLITKEEYVQGSTDTA